MVWICREKICRFYDKENTYDGEESTNKGREKNEKIIKKYLMINNLDRSMILNKII